MRVRIVGLRDRRVFLVDLRIVLANRYGEQRAPFSSHESHLDFRTGVVIRMEERHHTRLVNKDTLESHDVIPCMVISSLPLKILLENGHEADWAISRRIVGES